MEWLGGKVEGDNAGYRNVRNFQPSKQRVFFNTAYSVKHLWIEVILIAGHADNVLPAVMFHPPHKTNLTLDVLLDVFGSYALPNRSPERFRCWWPWPPRSPDMNPGSSSLWFSLKDCVNHTNLHTVQEVQAETETVSEQVTGELLCDTGDKFVVRLLRVHEVEGSHIERVLTWRPHAYKISMKVSFRSCIIWFCTLENYRYTVYRNCYVFFLNTL